MTFKCGCFNNLFSLFAAKLSKFSPSSFFIEHEILLIKQTSMKNQIFSCFEDMLSSSGAINVPFTSSLVKIRKSPW